MRISRLVSNPLLPIGAALLALGTLVAAATPADLKSEPFRGAKVNGGTVTCTQSEAGVVLTLSDDFVIPDTPAPHWQVVDSMGNVHLLQRLVVKGDVFHKSITLPRSVPDVAKVQIWCAFAETLLGETELACSTRTASLQEGVVHWTDTFRGPKANKGKASHTFVGGKHVLSLSDDFVVPETPAPHWQVVDSKGNTYLLNRLVIKDGKFNKTIELPAYVADVAKVQIWCAFAEVLLGEASFGMPKG